jgi:hypothetical protein
MIPDPQQTISACELAGERGALDGACCQRNDELLYVRAAARAAALRCLKTPDENVRLTFGGSRLPGLMFAANRHRAGLRPSPLRRSPKRE